MKIQVIQLKLKIKKNPEAIKVKEIKPKGC